METNIIKCETLFDTAKSTMTQIFSSRVKLIVDKKNLVIATLIDDRVADKFFIDKDYSLVDFNRLQQQVFQESKRLGGL